MKRLVFVVLAAVLLLGSAAYPSKDDYRILTRPADRFAPCGEIPAYLAPFMILASEEQLVPLETLAGVVRHESRNRLDAVNLNANGTVDRGPGQLNSGCLAWFAEKFNEGRPIDPHAPESVLITARILAWNRAQLGEDEVLWVAAYNQGVTGVKRDGPKLAYVARVLEG